MSQSQAFKRFQRRSRPMLSMPTLPAARVNGAQAPVSKAYLFRWAWQTARQAAIRFGGSPSLYFAESLREAWQGWLNDPLVRECHRMADNSTQGARGDIGLSVDNVTMLTAANRAQARLGRFYTKAY